MMTLHEYFGGLDWKSLLSYFIYLQLVDGASFTLDLRFNFHIFNDFIANKSY